MEQWKNLNAAINSKGFQWEAAGSNPDYWWERKNIVKLLTSSAMKS